MGYLVNGNELDTGTPRATCSSRTTAARWSGDAAAEGITLTDDHWKVVDYLRDEYREQGHAQLPQHAQGPGRDPAGLRQQVAVRAVPGGPGQAGAKVAGCRSRWARAATERRGLVQHPAAPHPPPWFRPPAHQSQWFKPGVARGADHASAMAFIVFRQANHGSSACAARIRDRCRAAYFAFLHEVLAFLVAVTDGWPTSAWRRWPRRVHHRAGAPSGPHAGRNETTCSARAEGAARYEDRFIDLVNALSGHYAEFGADPQAQREGRDFEPTSRSCYLGHRLDPAARSTTAAG